MQFAFAPRIKHRSGYGQLACFFLEHLSPAEPVRHSQRVYCWGATTQAVSTGQTPALLRRRMSSSEIDSLRVFFLKCWLVWNADLSGSPPQPFFSTFVTLSRAVEGGILGLILPLFFTTP